MDVVDVSLLLPAQYPKVLLREAEAPFRALEFAVGLAEGTAIAQALNRTPTPGRSPISSSPTPCGRSPSTSWPCGSWAGWARTTAPRSICGRTGDARCSTAVPPTHWPGAAPRRPCPILADERLLDTEGDVSAP